MALDTRAKRVLSQYVEDMKRRRLHPEYVRGTEATLTRFCRYCEARGIKSARKIRMEEVEGYLNQYNHMSGGYQKVLWAKVKGFLKYAANPLVLTYRRRIRGPERYTITWLTESEIQTLLNAELDPLRKVMVYAGLLGMLRRGEILALRVWEVEQGLKTGWLPIKGKGYKPRLIPLHPKLRGALEEYLETIPCEKDQALLPISYNMYSDRLRDASETLGIHFSSHTLRRSGARMAKKVTDLEVVQALLGHSNPAMTLRYIGDQMDEMQKAVEAMTQVTKSVQALAQPVR